MALFLLSDLVNLLDVIQCVNRVQRSALFTFDSDHVHGRRRDSGCDLLCVALCQIQVLAGPHKGQTLRLNAGDEVRVGRGAPRKNGLRLDKDLEVSEKCVLVFVGRLFRRVMQSVCL